MDERETCDGSGSRGAGDREEAGPDARRGFDSGLALRFAATHPFCRGRGGFRRADAGPAHEYAESAGTGCLAEFIPPGAILVGGGFCAGGPAAAESGGGDGARFGRSRYAAGGLTARRNPDDNKFYRTAVADFARGIRASFAGMQRLGARSKPPAADVQSSATGAARRDVDRATVRRRHDVLGRNRLRAGLWPNG